MNFYVGDKVYVNRTNHLSVLAGMEGIVRHTFYPENKIGVELFGIVNPITVTGLFWFDESELTGAQNHSKSINPFSIKNVYFNDPVTVVMWEDGTKTIVRCGENEEYDPEKGLAMAISKKALGNKGNYYEQFKKWIPSIEAPCETCEHRNKYIFQMPCFECVISQKYLDYEPISAKK